MFQKTTIAAAVLALSLPLSAFAGDKEFSEDVGPYSLWASVDGDNASYAVVNGDSDRSTVAEITDGKGAVLSGDEATAAIKKLKGDKHDHRVMLFKGEGDSGLKVITGDGSHHKTTIIKMKDHDSDHEGVEIKMDIELDGDMDVDIEKLLEDSGVTEMITEDGTRKIIVMDLSEGDGEEVIEEVIEDVVENEDGASKTIIKKKIKIVRMSDGPTPPTPPGAPVANGDENVSITIDQDSKMKSVFKFKSDDDGVEKTYIRISGATKKEARDFINDIDDLSRRQKRTMRKALDI